LVINGLGFTERRLYLFPTYFKDLALEELFAPGIVPEDFNEGRINRFSLTKLFNLIAMNCKQRLAFGTHLLHVDTTSFSVHGQYEGDDCQNAIEITLGHD
jgi:transposase